ncbi:glycosyltransferase family 2 protein [Halorubrum lipolyticum]|uniref:Glycosyl transferase n=1 Tax=Halorubrum lipolyticum DSM 21995 TaxID=1227482 RepID=M0P4E2_9EURY|nr:glycosyltransferase family A protein [Halorubrum lipolyticum]EMA63695.1 glycosyl transferase [Halorubrum lipolyticum DSM 21995]
MDRDADDEERPLVSVVLPTYDRPEYLREAVESVREQTYDPIELVVVDDCSPTPAARTLDRIDTGALAVTCRRHESNRGANAARNTGIDAAAGEFVAFLDDDDRWRPPKVERQVERFGDDEALGLVYTGQEYVNGEGRTTELKTPGTAGDAAEAILRGAGVGPFSTLMARADTIDAVGRPDERLPSWQDRDWVIRIASRYRIAPVREPLVVRRMEAHDQISDDFEGKRDVSYPLMLEKHRERAATYGPGTERRFVANLSVKLADAALANGYHRDAVRFAARAIRAAPRARSGYLYLLVAAGGEFTYRPAKFLKRASVRYRR